MTPHPNPRELRSRPRRGRRVLVLVAILLVAGIVLERLGILDWRAGVALAQGYADRWWLMPALALVTAALFAASLPGSLMIFVVAILLPPAAAAFAFVSGGVAGALGAHALARAAGVRDGTSPDEGRLLRLLRRQSDFLTLLAVRLAPGFPHSAINLAAGALDVPRGRFLSSTALGLAIKGSLYVAAIHQARRVATVEEAISWRTLAPLAALSLLLLLAPPLLRRLRGRREEALAPVEPS